MGDGEVLAFDSRVWDNAISGILPSCSPTNTQFLPRVNGGFEIVQDYGLFAISYIQIIDFHPSIRP